MSGASVELVNNQTGVSISEKTNSQGEYTIPLLQPGSYRLSISAGGFKRYSRPDFVFEAGRVSRLDANLEVGAISETVEVHSSTPIIESESSSVGQFIENATIKDMPLNGRRVGDLLALQGAAVYITGDVIRPRVAVAGGRADQQQWLLDGANSSNIGLEAPQALFNPPVESLQEMRVQQNTYSAEFGNSSAGVVTMITRSGSNAFHGTAYEFFRNDALDARNTFAAIKAPLRWNVYGFTLGGPVIRNRTFFFTNVEWQKQRIGATRTATTPTSAQIGGDFSQTYYAANSILKIYDPASTRPDPTRPGQFLRDPFPGNMIPAARFDPVGAKLAAQFPIANATPTNIAGANNFVQNAVNKLDLTTWTSKVDHTFSEKDRVSVRFLIHNFPTSATAAYNVAAADPNGNFQDRRAYSTLAEHIHTFTSALVNDFRYEWQPRFFHFRSLGLGDGWPAKLGLKGVDDRAFPRVTTAGFADMGNTLQERDQRPIHDTDIHDVLSWFRGAHAIRFGGESVWGATPKFSTTRSPVHSFSPSPQRRFQASTTPAARSPACCSDSPAAPPSTPPIPSIAGSSTSACSRRTIGR